MNRYILIIASVTVLLFLLIFIKSRKRKQKLNSINYTEEGRNIALSIKNCKKLHKELTKMIHPDKITDANKEEANELMQKVNDSRFNYKELQNVKLEIEIFLNTK